MQKSDNIQELATAIQKVQGELKEAKRDKENPYFKSKYADLSAVWGACREALQNNGFSVVQTSTYRDGHFFLETVLLHTSGQYISSEYLIKAVKEDPQAYGSAYTYARRYSLAAIVGVTTEDDDAEGATSHTEEPIAAPKRRVIDRLIDGDEPLSVPQIKPSAPTGSILENISLEASDEFNGAEWNQKSPNGVTIETFVPLAYSSKPTKKDGQTRYAFKNNHGEWFSTFDDALGHIGISAKEEKRKVTVTYKIDGTFKNIVDLELV